ncbi:hypothetical protein ACT4EA_004806 [Escherichia coli]
MFIIYNKTLAIFGIPCIILFLISCAVFAWSVFKKNERVFNITILSTIVLFAGTILTIITPTYDDDDIKNGETWSQCKLMEENSHNGSFSENVNKIECKGVIKNIPVSTYHKALYAYNKRKPAYNRGS